MVAALPDALASIMAEHNASKPPPKRRLLNWLGGFIDYTGFSESPTLMHFWTGVWTLAGALRRRVWIEQGYFQWTPNVYLILVAPPGIVSKSTTLANGSKLLKQVEGIKFGPDAVTWQALTQALAEANESVLMPDQQYHPMSCVSIASSEFGTLFNPSDREMVDVMVSLWDGQIGVWEKRTKTQGSDRIENPWINMAACTTPGWIAGNFPEYLIGGGFTSRCLFVYAEEKRHLVAYPDDILPPEFKQMEEDLVHDLRIIASMAGRYTLSLDARALGTVWYEEHYTNKKKELDTPKFAGYLARKQTHIHKLAMILEAAKSDNMEIQKDTLAAAIQAVNGLEELMPKVFDLIGISGSAKFSNQILMEVKSHKTIERTELFRLCFKTMGRQEFELGLDACLNAGYCSSTMEGTQLMIRYNGQK